MIYSVFLIQLKHRGGDAPSCLSHSHPQNYEQIAHEILNYFKVKDFMNKNVLFCILL